MRSQYVGDSFFDTSNMYHDYKLFQRLQEEFQAEGFTIWGHQLNSRWCLLSAYAPGFNRHIFAVVDSWAERGKAPQVALFTSFVADSVVRRMIWGKATRYLSTPDADAYSVQEIRQTLGKVIYERTRQGQSDV